MKNQFERELDIVKEFAYEAYTIHNARSIYFSMRNFSLGPSTQVYVSRPAHQGFFQRLTDAGTGVHSLPSFEHLPSDFCLYFGNQEYQRLHVRFRNPGVAIKVDMRGDLKTKISKALDEQMFVSML